MKIGPSLLAEKFETFLLMLRQAESFTDYVQIDRMDGALVPTKRFAHERIHDISTSLTFELHLMAEDPSICMEGVGYPGTRKVLLHFESSVDHQHLINTLAKRGITSGLAISPETRIGEFKATAEYVDTLLFLTVSPGFYGNPFRPDVLARVADARKLFPTKTVTPDGGLPC